MPLAAACAVVAVFFVVEGNGADDNDGVRVRGDGLVARLLVRRGDVVFAFAGEPLRAGDAVRVEVALARAARCSVVGVDVHGQRVLHYDAVAVARGTQVLPDSLVLDDSVGAEALVVACANDANELAGVELIEPAQLAARHPRARIAKLMFTKEPPAR